MRIRTHVRTHITHNTQSLLRADDALDLGEPDNAAKPLAQAREFYEKVLILQTSLSLSLSLSPSLSLSLSLPLSLSRSLSLL